MPDVDEAAVLRRAKALAERDGFAWELNFQPVTPGAQAMPQPYLSEERRLQYLTRAQTELREESDDA
jgi:hypothetical protein